MSADMCSMCALFLADPEFGDCCSRTCQEQLYAYNGDLDDEYIRDHLTLWSEVS